MIHAAIMGSLERFLSILIEHLAGAFPLWLCPVQVRILPVSEKHTEYAKSVLETLVASGIRAEVDGANESLGKKIRNAKTEKIPYVLVLGDQEVTDATVTVESRDAGKVGAMSINEFLAKAQEEIKNRS